MPTILDKNQEEEQEVPGDQQQSVQTTTGGSAQAGAVSGAQGGQGGGSIASREGSKSGRFTNLENYMRGNKQGAQQTTGLITGQAQEKAGAAQESLSGEETRIGGALGGIQTEAQTQQQEAKDALGGFKALEKGGDFATNYNNYTKELQEGVNTKAQTQEQLGQVQLQDQQARQQQIQDAEEYGKTITTEQGRQAALQRLASKPTYTKGQSALDTLLTGTGENMQRIQEQSQQVQDLNLSQRAADLENNLATRKQEIQAQVEQGLIDPATGQGLLDQIQSEAQNIRSGLETQQKDFARQYASAASSDILTNNEAAVRQALGDRIVDTPSGQAVRMGNINGQDVLVSLDKLLAANASRNQFVDVQSNYTDPSSIGLGQISPEDAIKLNALTRMSGLSEEQLGGQLIDGAEIDNLDQMQALTPEDALQYKSRLGDIQKDLDPSVAANFSQVKDMSNNTQLAQHYLTNAKDAVGDMSRPEARDAMKSMLTPEQQNMFESAFNTGAMGSGSFSKFAQMAVDNTNKRAAVESALKNMYGGAFNYEDLTGLEALPGDGKAGLY